MDQLRRCSPFSSAWWNTYAVISGVSTSGSSIQAYTGSEVSSSSPSPVSGSSSPAPSCTSRRETASPSEKLTRMTVLREVLSVFAAYVSMMLLRLPLPDPGDTVHQGSCPSGNSRVMVQSTEDTIETNCPVLEAGTVLSLRVTVLSIRPSSVQEYVRTTADRNSNGKRLRSMAAGLIRYLGLTFRPVMTQRGAVLTVENVRVVDEVTPSRANSI